MNIRQWFKQVTYAFAGFVRFTLGAVLEWVVFVTDFPEEVDLILASEERSSNTMDGGVAPSLSGTRQYARNFD